MSEQQPQTEAEETPELLPVPDGEEAFLFDEQENIIGADRANYLIQLAQLAQEAARWERVARSEKSRRVLYEKLLTPAQKRKAKISEPLPPGRTGKGKPQSKKKK